MTSRHLSGVALGILAIYVVPLIVSMKDGRIGEVPGEASGEPWPRLLVSEPASVDHDVAMLRLRAHFMLDRLKQSGRAAPEPL